MAFAGIIFDFNGVLWWDTHLQEQSWRAFSAALRGVPLSAEEMAVHVFGRTNRHTMEYLTGRAVDGNELREMVQRKETLYRQLCVDQGAGFRLSPGAVELLDWLAARHVPRTIATASDWINVDFFIQHLDLGRWFSLGQIVYDDGTRPGKPAPDLYLQAAANLGLAPGQCVVVEDSLSGLEAAQAAGIGYILALGPTERQAELARQPGVGRTITSLSEVPRDTLFVPGHQLSQGELHGGAYRDENPGD